MRKGKPSLPNATSPKAARASSPKSPHSFLVAIRTVSLTNQREHWSKRAKRAKEQRALVGMTIGNRIRGLFPCTVTITRCTSTKRRIDTDNLQGALKSVRDAVADCLGVDDSDERIVWCYGQESGGMLTQSVRIEVMAL